MKKMILATAALLISASAFADTGSQQTAKKMVAVLQSKEIQALLAKESSIGNFEGIKYTRSGRATFGPSQYELSFKSYSGPVPQMCIVTANVNIRTDQVISLSKAACQELK